MVQTILRKRESWWILFFSAGEKGIKIHSIVVNRPSHKVYMMAESETFEDIEKMFEPILTMTDAKITPVMPMTLDWIIHQFPFR